MVGIRSGKVEAVEICDLVPGGDKVGDEFLSGVRAGMGF